MVYGTGKWKPFTPPGYRLKPMYIVIVFSHFFSSQDEFGA